MRGFFVCALAWQAGVNAAKVALVKSEEPMRAILILGALSLGACSVANQTEKNSGAGISNSMDVEESQSVSTTGDTNYRDKLMSEIGG